MTKDAMSRSVEDSVIPINEQQPVYGVGNTLLPVTECFGRRLHLGFVNQLHHYSYQELQLQCTADLQRTDSPAPLSCNSAISSSTSIARATRRRMICRAFRIGDCQPSFPRDMKSMRWIVWVSMRNTATTTTMHPCLCALSARSIS